MNGAREKIAVLGGGVGGMTAAFELTATPQLRERYDVTVYQLGWRVGGQGASGRNAAYGQR
ncbi:MAG TPA: NAD(P)-binding protein, partial [Thermoleophilaceae bacterium]|nr:NAD(P)-binding protein [Thermoleophilaceae bacterium]